MKDHETCGRKRRYWNQTEATIHAGIAAHRLGKKMRTYRCPTCNGWHLASVKEQRA